MTAQEIVRCPWAGIAEPIYARYHDEEWGVPQPNDRALFEKLVLEGFQAGLSWLTILQEAREFPPRLPRLRSRAHRPLRRQGHRAPDGRSGHRAQPAQGGGHDRQRPRDAEARRSARALSAFLWGFLDGRPQINRHKSFKTVPAETPISKAISKALKAEGFRFVGPTTVYAFMQSTGMVNDHLVDCHRHEACAELQRRFKAPAERASA